VGWNVVCQPGYVAEEAVAAATDGLGDLVLLVQKNPKTAGFVFF